MFAIFFDETSHTLCVRKKSLTIVSFSQYLYVCRINIKHWSRWINLQSAAEILIVTGCYSNESDDQIRPPFWSFNRIRQVAHLMRSFLGPRDVSRSFRPFLQSRRSWPTDTNRGYAYSVGNNRPTIGRFILILEMQRKEGYGARQGALLTSS